jgi:hypothetical protein
LFRAYRWTFIDPAQWGGIFLHFIYLIIFLSTCFWFIILIMENEINIPPEAEIQ